MSDDIIIERTRTDEASSPGTEDAYLVRLSPAAAVRLRNAAERCGETAMALIERVVVAAVSLDTFAGGADEIIELAALMSMSRAVSRHRLIG